MPWRRSARAVLALAAVLTTASVAEAGEEPVGPSSLPKRVATLGKGSVWHSKWKLVAYRDDEGLYCETLLRDGARTVCSNIQPTPNPVFITASFTRKGKRPTTFAVVAASAKVARITAKLVPSQEPLSLVPGDLDERARRRAGLPRGFAYSLVALDRVQGFRAFRAFDSDGDLVGRYEGYPAP